MYEEVRDMLFPIIQKESSKPSSDDEDEESSGKKGSSQKLRECAFESLGKAWPSDKATQEKYQDEFSTTLCKCLPESTFKVRVIILKSLNLFLQRLCIQESIAQVKDSPHSKIIAGIVTGVCDSLGVIKYSPLRKEALSLVESMKTKLTDNKCQALLHTDLLKQLVTALKLEKADVAMRERADGLRLELEGWGA